MSIISVPLRRVARMQYGDALATETRTQGDVPVLSSGGVSGAHDTANTQGPVIVIGRKGSFGSVHWSDRPAFVIDTAFYIDARTTSCDLRWLYYTLSTLNLSGLSTDVGIPGLSRESAHQATVPFVDRAEQRRIAAFLDKQVARIDVVIDSRRKQLELFAQARVAELATAIAEITQTSEAHRLKFLVREIDVRAGAASADELLSVSIHHGVVPRTELTDDLPKADDLGNYKRVSAGDLVLNRMRAFQGAVGVAEMSGVVSPDYCVLRCGPKFSPGFAHFLFRSDWFVGEMVSRLRGIGSTDVGVVRTPRVNVEDLLDIVVPCPELVQQTQLMDRLSASQAVTLSRRAVLERSLDLLSEYKRSLITAAVTGEFDVAAASGRGVPA